MARKKRSVKAFSKERAIPVVASDINLLLDKWDRMTVRDSTFFQTWCFAYEAARLLGVFVERDVTKPEEN